MTPVQQKRSGLLLLLVVGLVVIASTWVLREQVLPARKTADIALEGSSASAPAALAEQYRQLDARLARLEMLIGASLDPMRPNSVRTPLPTTDPAAELEKEQALAAQRRARYQSLFESDARGADASKWEATISRAFSDSSVADVADQPSTRSAQCRARLCQITAKFPPDTDGSVWAMRISMALVEGFTSSRTSWVTLPSGETVLTLYAFKKGAGDRMLQEQRL